MFQLIQTLKNSEVSNLEKNNSVNLVSTDLSMEFHRRKYDDADLEEGQRELKTESDYEFTSRKVKRQSFESPKRIPNSSTRLNAYGMSDSAMAVQPVSKAKERGDTSDRIRVCVRKRPLSKKEMARKETDVALVNGRRTIHFYEPKVKVDLTKYVETHEFVFDEVFDSDATNDDVYSRTAQPLVEYVFSGGKATCFAYGQTGIFNNLRNFRFWKDIYNA